MTQQALAAADTLNTKKNSYENTHIFDKTRLCKFYAKGKCKRGQACTFAHGDQEMQPQPNFFRTQLCADFVRSGGCKSGLSCSYAHGPQELRRAKTHKSSKSSGLRKVADPEVSLEVHRLEMLHQEAVRLRSQLVTLQAITEDLVPSPACTPGSKALLAFKAGTCQSPKLVSEQGKEEHADGIDATTGFSRQSTEEGSELPVCFSRQSTFEDGDAWDDLAPVSCSSNEETRLHSEVEEDEQEEVACELHVKRTFISVEPVKAGSRRRAYSAHPARHQSIV